MARQEVVVPLIPNPSIYLARRGKGQRCLPGIIAWEKMAKKASSSQFPCVLGQCVFLVFVLLARESCQLPAATPTGKGLTSSGPAVSTESAANRFLDGKQDLGKLLSAVSDALKIIPSPSTRHKSFDTREQVQPPQRRYTNLPSGNGRKAENKQLNEALNSVCFSRNLEKIMDPNTGTVCLRCTASGLSITDSCIL